MAIVNVIWTSVVNSSYPPFGWLALMYFAIRIQNLFWFNGWHVFRLCGLSSSNCLRSTPHLTDAAAHPPNIRMPCIKFIIENKFRRKPTKTQRRKSEEDLTIFYQFNSKTWTDSGKWVVIRDINIRHEAMSRLHSLENVSVVVWRRLQTLLANTR